MKVANNTVVQIHYTLTSKEGKIIDTSSGREPLEYIQGTHGIVIGLENAMEGHEVGDKFDVHVIPKEGYGEYEEAFVQEVPVNVFQGVDQVEVGMSFYAQTPGGIIPVTIKEIKGDKALIDANHELAGKDLYFSIEVVSVREATEEDLKPKHHCCGRHKDGEHKCCKEEGEGCCENHDSESCQCLGEECCKNKEG